MSVYKAWLFLQDGGSSGISLSTIGSNLLSNPIEKIITYKNFLKLIPNPSQSINDKSSLKLLAEWTISGEYYQLYGWTSGQSSKINAHNFDLEDYPDQDFYGDLILFKVEPETHQCLEINEIDVQTIDIANREEEIDEDTNEYENEEEDYSEDEKDKPKDGEDYSEGDEDEDEDDDNEAEEVEEDEKENDVADDFDDKGNVEDCLEDEFCNDEEEIDNSDKKKKSNQKQVPCNFTRLVCDSILKERDEIDKNYLYNTKQVKIMDIFKNIIINHNQKDKNTTPPSNTTISQISNQINDNNTSNTSISSSLINEKVNEKVKKGRGRCAKKTEVADNLPLNNNINSSISSSSYDTILCELERGIYNWSIRVAEKNGFMCLWNDRQFDRIYTRKAISIYQNLSTNSKLLNFILENPNNSYQISFMKPIELCPEKYEEILSKLKEKEKVIFEKKKGMGSKYYKCGKCKERDVSVSTAQTRSGDEGITLFLTCNNCGNQWKMS